MRRRGGEGRRARSPELGQNKTQPSFLGTLLSSDMGDLVAEMGILEKAEPEDLEGALQWNDLGSENCPGSRDLREDAEGTLHFTWWSSPCVPRCCVHYL